MPQPPDASAVEAVVATAIKRYRTLLDAQLAAADGQPYCEADLVMYGLINRNLGLLRAMPCLVAGRNIQALTPLLRVQLDGLLRLHAFAVVDSMEDLARHIRAGQSVGKFTDRHGQKLTDRYLVGLVKPAISVIEDMYTTLSGWVHLSESHLGAAVAPGPAANSFVLAVGDQESVPDQLFDEAVGAIELVHEATAELLENYFGRLSKT